MSVADNHRAKYLLATVLSKCRRPRELLTEDPDSCGEPEEPENSWGWRRRVRVVRVPQRLEKQAILSYAGP